MNKIRKIMLGIAVALCLLGINTISRMNDAFAVARGCEGGESCIIDGQPGECAFFGANKPCKCVASDNSGVDPQSIQCS